MKKLMAKLRTKSFWVTLLGALTLILSRLGYSDAAGIASKIVDSVAGILLLLGIAVSPAGEAKDDKNTSVPDTETDDENLEE